MQVNGQQQTSATLTQEEHRKQLTTRMGGPQSRSGYFEYLLLLRDSNPGPSR